jgi:hypothetical protein
VGETTKYFGAQKQANTEQFTYKKNIRKNIICQNLHTCIFWGNKYFTYESLEHQKLKQERSCEVLTKKTLTGIQIRIPI